MNTVNQQLKQQGFVLIPQIIETKQLQQIRQIIQSLTHSGQQAGWRNLLGQSPALRQLLQTSPLQQQAEAILGPSARVVRSLLFNKTLACNWHVAWHQDLSVAVQQRAELNGFSGWSTKDGQIHVQPPVEFLETMVTLRLHLDPTDATNGALRLIPGSHRLGRLSTTEALTIAKQGPEVLCQAQAGDLLIFRPLILHASNKATSNQDRRIVHLEYAAETLPPPLNWAEATD